MQDQPPDHELQDAHKKFQANHNHLKHELMDRLPEATNPAAAVGIARDVRGNLHRIASNVAVVASVLAIVGGTMLFMFGDAHSNKAYGNVEVFQRFLNSHNVRVKGRRFKAVSGDSEQAETVVEFEWYAERPGAYWFSLTTQQNGTTSQTYEVAGGERYLSVDVDNRLATTGKQHEQEAELFVERLIQVDLLQALTSGRSADYVFHGVELVNGLTTERFERSASSPNGIKMRYVIWINPADNLPIKVEIYRRDGVTDDRLFYVFDEIEVDLPSSPEGFSFIIPDGFSKQHIDRAFDNYKSMGAVKFEQEELVIRFAFAVTDNEFLVCWSNKPNPDPTLFMTPHSYRHYPLRRVVWQDRIWHWSLLVNDLGVDSRVGERIIYLSTKPGGRHNIAITPLRIGIRRLESLLDWAQRGMLEGSLTPNELITVDEVLSIRSSENGRL